MAKRTGLTRGDRRRNDRIEALREVVRPDRAIFSIDLGEDKQVAVLMDHEGRVLARRTVKAKAHALGALLEWAAGQAVRHGFAGVVVGCEPTGHRWRSVMQLADEAGMGFVCVQSLRVHLAREADDYTRDKTDLLTELRGGFRSSMRQPVVGVATVPGHGWREGRRAGPVPVGRCARWVA